MNTSYDLAVVGAGIVGLAHAYVAARLGKRVIVLERNGRALGASIRNFGFVTVTGQGAADTWRRASRSREIWSDVAPACGIAVEHRGLLLSVRRPQSLAVVEAFLRTAMGEGCSLLDRAELVARLPCAAATDAIGALHSPHELRVESRNALPQLVHWLRERWNVEFRFDTAVHEVDPPRLQTARGPITAEAAVVCPGDDFVSLFPDRMRQYRLTKCRLSMMRLASPGFRLPAALMSDLGLLRYQGYSELPEAAALRACIEGEQPDALRNGVHLIAVQSADGTLVVGDSHHYDDAPEPFAASDTEREIVAELAAATGIAGLDIVERWIGVYASAPDRPMFMDAPLPGVRLVVITSGTGASTAFAIAEEVLGDLFDRKIGATA